MFKQMMVFKAVCCSVASLFAVVAGAQQREFASVPPALEIEILDPGVDSMGVPAVQLQPNGQVDIPPVVMVHRYYYSGDRSFQGPLLPGGPSILVVNHPKTGQRIYVPAQMMPGAPRVTYTKKGITYQYEKHAVMLSFTLRGEPVIKYRSGLGLQQKIGNVLHFEAIGARVEKVKGSSRKLAQRCKTTAVGITADVVDATKVVTLPVQNILQSLPIGKQIFSKDSEAYYAERAAVFQRDMANKHAEKQRELAELTIPTNR